jgi:hypothetical protein
MKRISFLLVLTIMILARATRFAALLGIYLLAGSMLQSGSYASASAQEQEARLRCGANPGAECSFILWDGHGSRGFVVGARQLTGIGTAYMGFKYCMHAGLIHAPMPNWPACFNNPNTPQDTHGVIRPGNQG